MNEKSKVLDRVRKMLAMANDERGNEHEREAAMRMAHSLLIKHGLDMLEVEKSQRDAEDPRGQFENDGYGMKWALFVRNCIARLYMCKYIQGSKINSTRTRHIFVGRESNATVAMDISEFVVNSILQEARKRYRQTLCAETRAFGMGCAVTIAKRVDAIIADRSHEFVEESKALVLVAMREDEEKGNAAFIAENLETVQRNFRRTRLNAGAYADGSKFGERVGLNPQVSSAKQNLLR